MKVISELHVQMHVASVAPVVAMTREVLRCVCWDYARQVEAGIPAELAFVGALQLGAALEQNPDEVASILAQIDAPVIESIDSEY